MKTSDNLNLTSTDMESIASTVLDAMKGTQQQQQSKLTASEIGNLWTTYQHDSMAFNIFQHTLEKAEDPEIRLVLEDALNSFERNLTAVRQIFEEEAYPIPHGFTEEDLNRDVPRLFSDSFWLYYTHMKSTHWLTGYELGLTTSSRDDVYNFYADCIKTAMEIYHQSLKVLKSKGMYQPAPTISTPESIEFVHRQSFLTGWFGDRRPLNAMEITNIFFNIKRDQLTEALMLGFSQVAKSKESSQFMARIKQVLKHTEIFSSLLHEDHLYSPGSVAYMLLYQYFKTWKSFSVGLVSMAAIYAFIGEPLTHWLDQTLYIKWKHIYSFFYYILAGILVRWMVEKVVGIARKSN